MTLTQEKQPYGRETRRTEVRDGITYVVSLAGAGYFPYDPSLERWELRQQLGRAFPRIAYADMPCGKTAQDAAMRLLGDV